MAAQHKRPGREARRRRQRRARERERWRYDAVVRRPYPGEGWDHGLSPGWLMIVGDLPEKERSAWQHDKNSNQPA